MLSYALAIAIALSSLVLFSTAFVMSDAHRKDDFLWSGVGLFYALVLWYCTPNLKGAVLLGQTAATLLIISYSWQTLKLRKAIANPAKAQEISQFSLLQSFSRLLNRRKSEQPAAPPRKSKVTSDKIAIPDVPSAPNESAKTQEASQSQSNEVASPEAKPVDQPEENPSNQKAKTSPIDPLSSSPAVIASEPNSQATAATNSTEESEGTPLNQSSESATEQEISSATEAPKTLINEDNSATPITPETASSEDDIPQPDVEPLTTASSQLDNLEVVEVAEVLEALPDNASDQKNADQSNVIEIATTDIKNIDSDIDQE